MDKSRSCTQPRQEKRVVHLTSLSVKCTHQRPAGAAVLWRTAAGSSIFARNSSSRCVRPQSLPTRTAVGGRLSMGSCSVTSSLLCSARVSMGAQFQGHGIMHEWCAGYSRQQFGEPHPPALDTALHSPRLPLSPLPPPPPPPPPGASLAPCTSRRQRKHAQSFRRSSRRRATTPCLQ